MLRADVLLCVWIPLAACDETASAGRDAPASAPSGSAAASPATPAGEREPAPVAAEVALDCGALITVEDVARACGWNAGEITVGVDMLETGRRGATHCLRRARSPGRIAVAFVVNTAVNSPQGARALVTAAGDEARKVDVGDGGVWSVNEAAYGSDHALEATKGAIWFKVGYQKMSETQSSPCSDEGVIELGRILAGRLPE